MSLTIANIITNLDTYLSDTSTDRISQAERFQAITEATSWLQEELGNEHMVSTYDLEFVDSVYYYKVTTPVADLLQGAELRRPENKHTEDFIFRSAKEVALDIANYSGIRTWAIERKDGDIYLAINHDTENYYQGITSFDTITTGGTWTAADDATNVQTDTVRYKSGVGSLKFDVDVSLSGNDDAIIYCTDADVTDLSTYEDVGKFVLDVDLPDVTYISSITLTIGSAATPSTKTDYWSATVTTDINGSALVAGWNTIGIDWSDFTKTGSPDSSAISYYEIKVNYTNSQGDDTAFRLDNLRVAIPETLTFHYTSWDVGTDSVGTELSAFTATTDIPFFSGRYDQYKFAVAHKAASLLYYSPLRLTERGAQEERTAFSALNRYKKTFERVGTKESHAFKPAGLNFNKRRIVRRR